MISLGISRRYFRYFDWISFFLLLLLSTVGLLFVFSATYKVDQPYSLFFKKQLFGLASGILLYFVFCLFDYRILMRWGYVLYTLVILFLLFTLIKGQIGKGGQRWVDLLLFRFQPSELAKLFFPAFFAHYLFDQSEEKAHSIPEFLPIIGLLFFSCLLIIKQPDLGTGILILTTGILLLWFAGLSKRFFVLAALLLMVSTPLLWHYMLKPYQKQRITVFLGQGDTKKERYQLEQSQIAIGSGGLTGKGFLQGTQNKLLFLPESRTDFIFSVIAEEIGFSGVFTIILLFLLLFARSFWLITTINHFYVQLLALGLVMPCIISFLINIAMVMGLLPIVGIPLPLMSYGISHLWVTFASFGWLNGIYIRQSYIGD
jgi:rod shape determining protein RodA